MKVNIRTVTLESFIGGDKKLFSSFVEHKKVFENAGYTPRTNRVVSEPISNLKDVSLDRIQEYIKQSGEHNFWGVCIPFDISSGEEVEKLEIAKEIMKQESVFVNFLPINNNSTINISALPRISDFILDVSKDPVQNFRVGVSSMQNATPFFPFAVAGKDGRFSVGLELVGFLTELIRDNNRLNLDELRLLIKKSILEEAHKVEKVCSSFEEQTGILYGGIDLSLAPYPYPLEDQSVAALIEEIGCIARSRGEQKFEFGSEGTHFINGFLTNILKEIVAEGEIRTTGFNGVMYSVLEDTRLSESYADGDFDSNFLKLLATTCGCGVDMVPLPGGVKSSTITGILLDVLSAGVLLDKPLGVRVLPIPGLRSGDTTSFKHLFFSNTQLRSVKEGVTFPYLPTQQTQFSFKKKKYE